MVDFIHSQSQRAAIQLQHAGRKSSICPPWLGLKLVPSEHGGFPEQVKGPSGNEAWNENYASPSEMTEEEIWEVIHGFGSAAKWAVEEAGVDVIAVHGAHGYLIHEFASPASNHRTDSWGGSFSNRTRFGLEILRSIRRSIPSHVPVFWKISAVDWLPDGQGWEITDTLRYAPLLAAEGVDFLDVSSGGVDRRQKVELGYQYQVGFAKMVKDLKIPGLTVGAVGWIRDGKCVDDVRFLICIPFLFPLSLFSFLLADYLQQQSRRRQRRARISSRSKLRPKSRAGNRYKGFLDRSVS